MDLYNSIINKTEALLSASVPIHYNYSPTRVWSETKEFELVMMRDVAYELGGSGKASANFSCVTSDSELVPCDEVLVYGPDLKDLKADSTYARIALIRTDTLDTLSGANTDGSSESGADAEDLKKVDSEATFRAIQKIDFVKYHVFPKGYMIRTSSESNREQVRISKDALRSGISFEQIGNTFIKHYKEAKHVAAVRMIFITDPSIDYPELAKSAKTVHDITMTLSKILEGMPTDCHTCKLKPICDEVEGLKELHFGNKEG